MGTQRKTTTRRQFVSDVGCGFCGGALFGLGFTIADRWLRHPSIALVGTGDSQVALLLTSSSRVLVALGPWRPELIDALFPELGWSDRRIDLVLAGASDTVQARAWFTHQTIARRLALVASHQPTEAPMPDELVDRPWEVRIDGDTRLTIEPSHDYGHPNGETSRSPWAALVQRGRNQIWLAERASGLDLIVPFQPQPVLVVPNGEPFATATALQPRAISCNVGDWMNSLILPASQETAEAKTTLVRTFPREPAVIELSDEGLRLPTWTTQFSQTFTEQGNTDFGCRLGGWHAR